MANDSYLLENKEIPEVCIHWDLEDGVCLECGKDFKAKLREIAEDEYRNRN